MSALPLAHCQLDEKKILSRSLLAEVGQLDGSLALNNLEDVGGDDEGCHGGDHKEGAGGLSGDEGAAVVGNREDEAGLCRSQEEGTCLEGTRRKVDCLLEEADGSYLVGDGEESLELRKSAGFLELGEGLVLLEARQEAALGHGSQQLELLYLVENINRSLLHAEAARHGRAGRAAHGQAGRKGRGGTDGGEEGDGLQGHFAFFLLGIL